MKKTMIFAAAAMAMASAFADFSFAYLDTEGAKDATTANDAAYTAYLCTAAAAGEFFGGNTSCADITAYLADNYAIGMGALKADGTAMSLYGFDEDEYTFYAPFKKSGEGSLANDAYIAVVAYADGADNMLHVFDSTACEGKMAFQSKELGGNFGGWTVAAGWLESASRGGRDGTVIVRISIPEFATLSKINDHGTQIE